MDAYPHSITESSSPEALLFALRDAITGHQNLWRTGIIHRDISINNTLLGPEGAPEGSRGIVIDLDLAVKTDHKTSLYKVDRLTRTHAFQSFLELRSEQLTSENRHDEIPAHDHLDDLESFFYVFLWITVGYQRKEGRPSIELGTRPASLQVMQAEALIASGHKYTLLDVPNLVKLNPSWPAQFSTLKRRLSTFFNHHIKMKINSPPQQPCLCKAEAHYAIVLGYIDQTLQELKDSKVADPKTLTTDFVKEESDALD
ncbi:hypothetical protein BJ165DRAFT_1524257 [Panaeolus papilionaceus]|nr:hypothetical protein BJ165DRAFT_1524257 [Panaeolus papilionaceus]